MINPLHIMLIKLSKCCGQISDGDLISKSWGLSWLLIMTLAGCIPPNVQTSCATQPDGIQVQVLPSHKLRHSKQITTWTIMKASESFLDMSLRIESVWMLMTKYVQLITSNSWKLSRLQKCLGFRLKLFVDCFQSRQKLELSINCCLIWSRIM